MQRQFKIVGALLAVALALLGGFISMPLIAQTEPIPSSQDHPNWRPPVTVWLSVSDNYTGEEVAVHIQELALNLTGRPPQQIVPMSKSVQLTIDPRVLRLVADLPGVEAVTTQPPQLPIEADDVNAEEASLAPASVDLASNTAVLKGKVTNANGDPLEGIDVSVYRNKISYVARVKTDPQGIYTFTQLSAGSYQLNFQDAKRVYLEEYYNDKLSLNTATDISVADGATVTTPDVSLTLGGAITGIVTDPDGNPLNSLGVSLYVYDAEEDKWQFDRNTWTGADGSYRHGALTSGTYRLGFGSRDPFIGEFYNDATDVNSAADIAVTVGQTTSAINAVLGRGGRIQGRVTNTDGQNVSGIRIAVDRYNTEEASWEDFFFNRSTSFDGTYDIGPLPTGTYRVFVRGNDTYLPTYHPNTTEAEMATGINVTLGETKSGIDIVVQKGAQIVGKVTNAQGEGLREIVVYAYFQDEEGKWLTWGSYRTDFSGTYKAGAFPTGVYRIHFATHNQRDYLSKYYIDADSLDSADDLPVTAGQVITVNTTLNLGGVIAGQITGGGQSIVNESVSLYARDDGSNTGWRYVTGKSTDDNGRYRFNSLIPGTYRLQASGDWESNFFSTYYGGTQVITGATDIQVSLGQTVTVDVPLIEGGVIAGLVTGKDGTPVPDVRVIVRAPDPDAESGWGFWRSAETDEDGQYRVQRLSTGVYRIEISPPFNSIYLNTYHSAVDSIQNAADVSATLGQTTTVNTTLIEGGYIAGRVTGSDSKPISGTFAFAYVETVDGLDRVKGSFSDADGRYQISGLEAGNYRIEFDAPAGDIYFNAYSGGADNQFNADAVAVARTETTTLDAVLAVGGIISGRVTDANGNPLENIRVSASTNPPVCDGSFEAGYTNADGVYRFGGLASGQYQVFFNSYNWDEARNIYVSQDTTGISVTVGQTTDGVDAALTPGGTIRGVVTAPSGSPLKDVDVTLYRYNQETQQWWYFDDVDTEDDGSYQMMGLPAGSYRVRFVDYSNDVYMMHFYGNATTLESATDVSVQAGQIADNINAQLMEGGQISGTVTDVNGKPIRFISVTIYRYNTQGQFWQWLRSDSTDFQGRYTVGGFPTGNYRIRFQDWSDWNEGAYFDEYYPDAGSLAEAADVSVTVGTVTENIDAVLAGGEGGTLTGLGQGFTGNTYYCPTIYAYRYNSEKNRWDFMNSKFFASTGRYEFRQLVPGTYRLQLDGRDSYTDEYYNDKPTLETADDVVITAGVTTPAINFNLNPTSKNPDPDPDPSPAHQIYLPAVQN
ncbi:hypothetical protein GC175_14980 [bacterium]|nr:hypothetical protein [bacterium]